jgi:hypothetical protein
VDFRIRHALFSDSTRGRGQRIDVHAYHSQRLAVKSKYWCTAESVEPLREPPLAASCAWRTGRREGRHRDVLGTIRPRVDNEGRLAASEEDASTPTLSESRSS